MLNTQHMPCAIRMKMSSCASATRKGGPPATVWVFSWFQIVLNLMWVLKNLHFTDYKFAHIPVIWSKRILSMSLRHHCYEKRLSLLAASKNYAVCSTAFLYLVAVGMALCGKISKVVLEGEVEWYWGCSTWFKKDKGSKEVQYPHSANPNITFARKHRLGHLTRDFVTWCTWNLKRYSKRIYIDLRRLFFPKLKLWRWEGLS